MTYLIKITISLFLLNTLAYANTHIPKEDKESGLSPYFIGRFFTPINKLHTFVATLSFREEEQRSIKELEVSLRRKVSKNLSYGIESNATIGQRHDDDWENDGAGFKWTDRSSEFDFGSTLYLKYKATLSFLPGRNWIAEINLKTHNNWTWTLLTLKPEVTLTYIHFKEGKALFNIYTKIKTYIPLNYSDNDVYAKWLYLGTLYHYSKSLKPSLFIAIKKQAWTRSEDFKILHSNETYEVKSDQTYIGFGLNYYY